MSAAQKGRNVLLKVGNGATPTEVFTTLQGQKDTKIAFSKDTIDATDKGSQGWKESLGGDRTATITCSGQAKWPDVAGLEALQAAFLDEDDVTVNCQAVINSDGELWQGAFHVTAFEISGPDGGTTDFSFTLQSSGEVAFVTA